MEYFLGILYGVLGIVIIMLAYSVGGNDTFNKFLTCDANKLSIQACAKVIR